MTLSELSGDAAASPVETRRPVKGEEGARNHKGKVVSLQVGLYTVGMRGCDVVTPLPGMKEKERVRGRA